MVSLDPVKNALLSVMDNVGHFQELKKKPPYCVWAEDGAISLRSDNATGDQAITGTIDLFTLIENDPLAGAIQTALDTGGISWRLNSIQTEQETGYIHYEWVWSIG